MKRTLSGWLRWVGSYHSSGAERCIRSPGKARIEFMVRSSPGFAGQCILPGNLEGVGWVLVWLNSALLSLYQATEARKGPVRAGRAES